ncbi:hypothetical protein [Gorillibacterium massiliense]|uniref:hypothetical protein n=1 Tax=Gorillibacterium massiliense TaxID=1280390 RepID=UPI0004B69EA4|nr:hypothetical protein [Gorillibacterium massiliense]
MNLADMLCFADIKDLGRIAETYELTCNTHSKNDLIQAILANVSRSDLLKQELGRLGWEEIRFMSSLLFDRRDSFSLEELTARVRMNVYDGEGQTEINPREIISRFKGRGWLFNGHRWNNSYLYLVPEDLKLRFRDTLARQFGADLVRIADNPAVYRDERLLLAEDLYRFLHFMTQNELPLNAEGYLYKRTLQQIQETFTISEEPVAKTAWRFGYGRRFREYPSRFSFIYDYCYYSGLIEERNAELVISAKGLKKVEEKEREDMDALYRFYLRLYKGAVPNLQALANWIECLTGEWTTLASLSGILGRLIKPYYYDTPESILEQRMIGMMGHLGLLLIGEDEREGRVVRTSRVGAKIIKGIHVSDDEMIMLTD